MTSTETVHLANTAHSADVRVAVVDDDPGQRYATSRFLREARFAVVEASTGADALALARTLPDVIILDVSLPDLDGFEVCRRIKADPETASVLVVQTSAVFRDSDDRVRGLDGGADAYIVQPTKLTELVATIRAVLRIRQYEMEQVRLLALEQEARRAAEDAERRVALLADASVILASSLDYHKTIEVLARRLLGDLADGVVIELVERAGRKKTPLIRWRDHAQDVQARSLAEERGSCPPELFIDAFGVQSVMVLPMTSAADQPLGTLHLYSSSRTFRTVDHLLGADIARRTAIAIDRAFLYEDARAAVASRDEVLSFVSHDLRNPLGVLIMSAHALREKLFETAVGPELKSHVERILRQATRMHMLLDDLSDITALDSGRLSINPQSEDLAALIAELRQGNELTATAKNIKLEMALPDSTAVVIDKKRVSQAFSNIVQNAISYTQAGGHVHVRLERATDGSSRLSIADDGPGIDAADLPRIFERNFRGRSSAGQHGSGLGLYITQGIMAAHGGQIVVESLLGRGTTFTLIFPAAPVA